MSIATLRFSGARLRALREAALMTREDVAVAIGRGCHRNNRIRQA